MEETNFDMYNREMRPLVILYGLLKNRTSSLVLFIMENEIVYYWFLITYFGVGSNIKGYTFPSQTLCVILYYCSETYDNWLITKIFVNLYS